METTLGTALPRGNSQIIASATIIAKCNVMSLGKCLIERVGPLTSHCNDSLVEEGKNRNKTRDFQIDCVEILLTSQDRQHVISSLSKNGDILFCAAPAQKYLVNFMQPKDASILL